MFSDVSNFLTKCHLVASLSVGICKCHQPVRMVTCQRHPLGKAQVPLRHQKSRRYLCMFKRKIEKIINGVYLYNPLLLICTACWELGTTNNVAMVTVTLSGESHTAPTHTRSGIVKMHSFNTSNTWQPEIFDLFCSAVFVLSCGGVAGGIGTLPENGGRWSAVAAGQQTGLKMGD